MTTENGLPEANDHLHTAIVDIAVDGWRLLRLFSRALTKLDAGEAMRYANQLRYFQKRSEESLDAIGLRFVSVEGHPYDAGIAATAINIGDFGPDDVLIVDQMVEPIVMGANGVIRTGAVLLRKVTA